MSLLLALAGFIYAEPCREAGSITRVKNRSVGRVEYVIFDIKKRADNAPPQFSVKSSKRPFTDYSGEQTYSIAGDKYKTIVFQSINWMCEIPQKYRLPKRAVKGIKLLSSFEGIVEFAVGYRSRSRYVTTYSYEGRFRYKGRNEVQKVVPALRLTSKTQTKLFAPDNKVSGIPD